MRLVEHHKFPTEKANNRMKYSFSGCFFLFIHKQRQDTTTTKTRTRIISFLLTCFHGMTITPPKNKNIFFQQQRQKIKWNQEERNRSKYTCSKLSHYFISSLSLSLTSHTHTSPITNTNTTIPILSPIRFDSIRFEANVPY